MARRTLRARVHGQVLEVLEGVPLPEGAEVEVTIEVPDPVSASPPGPTVFAVWSLGAQEPLTRREIYDDAD